MLTKALNSFFSDKFKQQISIKLLRKDNPMGSGFVVKTEKNKFFLKKYKQTRTLNDLEYEHDFVNYLEKCGAQVNQLVEFDHNTIFSIKENYFSLFTFANGLSKNVSEITQKEKISLIENIARMHKFSENFKPKFKKIGRDLFSFNFEGYIFKLYPDSRSLLNLKNDLELIKINIANKSNNLLKIIIHNDLSVKNIFFKNNKVSSIVDFDDCCFGARISDLVNVIFDFYCDGFQLRREEIDFFINQYSRISRLKRNEIDLVDDLLKHRLVIYVLFYFHYWKKTKKVFYLKDYRKYYKIFKNYDKL